MILDITEDQYHDIQAALDEAYANAASDADDMVSPHGREEARRMAEAYTSVSAELCFQAKIQGVQ